jgi:proteasome lid subunit RPN8/RPN11
VRVLPQGEGGTNGARHFAPGHGRRPVRDRGTPLDGSSPPAELRIGRALYERLLVHLLAAAPLEGVGLLAVAEDGAGGARATRFYPGTNVDASPTRYTMDPAEVLAAFRDIAAHGWRLGAIVHSHPATPPTPSPTDLREAHYPEALLVIVGLADAAPRARAWRIAVGAAPPAVVEVPLIVEQDG